MDPSPPRATVLGFQADAPCDRPARKRQPARRQRSMLSLSLAQSGSPPGRMCGAASCGNLAALMTRGGAPPSPASSSGCPSGSWASSASGGPGASATSAAEDAAEPGVAIPYTR
jgi:hypothetical protein